MATAPPRCESLPVNADDADNHRQIEELSADEADALEEAYRRLTGKDPL